MKKLSLPLLCAAALYGGGYKIPETSTDAVALGAANVAHAIGAHAAYYNPANMVFMKDESFVEANLIYIGLHDINYQGSYTASTVTSGGYDLDSKKENFLVPSLHYVSNDINGARFGLSVVSPAGLSKRWSDAPAVYSAEEFTLKTVEVNPSVALKIGDKIGVALGVRAIYSEGVVKSFSPVASRDMSGDSIDFGYNLALSYKPMTELELALTYRSKIDLSIEGDASLRYTDTANLFGGGIGKTYSSTGSATVSAPVPALLNLAAAYTFESGTTVELVYERNFWSEYKELDFDYGSGVNPVTNIVFGAPLAKEWKDSNVFRLGVTQELDRLTLMGGAIVDKTPVPNRTLGFELPDPDSFSLSLGAKYRVKEDISASFAALYCFKESRDVYNASIEGEFKDADILLVSVGLEYRF